VHPSPRCCPNFSFGAPTRPARSSSCTGGAAPPSRW
jgi:hypothetical protein